MTGDEDLNVVEVIREAGEYDHTVLNDAGDQLMGLLKSLGFGDWPWGNIIAAVIIGVVMLYILLNVTGGGKR